MLVQKHSVQRSKLSRSRKETLNELYHLRQEMMNEVDSEVEEVDEQITEHDTDSILIAMLENKVQDIDRALVAIDLGRYEICERCGQRIEPKRLAAKPDARLCISCQEEVDLARS
jgi:DnaK suppressor protein